MNKIRTSLQYGTIKEVELVHNDGKRAGGAVVGGLAGAAIADDEIEHAVIKVKTLCEV